MARHSYSFDGGENLASIGAYWFVSYAYFDRIDQTHRNWDRVSTVQYRTSLYHSTKEFHEIWLKEICGMNPSNLNKNTIGLSAQQIQQMSFALLRSR